MSATAAPKPAKSDDFLDLIAGERGDFFALAERLMADPALVNARSSQDVTALMFSVGGNPPGLTELLLDQGADINAVEDEKATALHWAVRDGNLECVKLLLDRGADWTLKDVAGKTARDFANTPLREGIAALLDAKAAPGAPGRPARVKDALDIAIAAAKGDSAALRHILSEYPDAGRWQERYTGSTALINAAWYGKLAPDDAQFLIRKGADVDARDKWGCTPLMYAFNRKEASPLADILIEAGANPLLAGNDGKTAVDFARAAGNPDCAKLEQYALIFSMRETQTSMQVRKPIALKR